jgi:hypothetical protein
MAQDKEAELGALFDKLDSFAEHGQHAKALKTIEQSEPGGAGAAQGPRRVRAPPPAPRRHLRRAVRRRAGAAPNRPSIGAPPLVPPAERPARRLLPIPQS